MEILFNYGKLQSKGMKDIFDELMDYLCSGEISQWNMTSIAKNFVKLKKEEFENATLGNQTDPKPCSGPTCPIPDQEIDKMNLDELSHLDMIFHMYQLVDEEPLKSDWSTKNIGTFFAKTVLQYPHQWLSGIDEINDAFTSPNENVSWPDIALMYNLKDFRVLATSGSKLNTPAKYTEPEPCEVYAVVCSPGARERYSSFQSCLNEVFKNYQLDEVTNFGKEDIMEKVIQSYPCQNLDKFQDCSEYCAWHNNFTETIGQEEFIQAMSYASPQRKVYKESMPIERKIAGTVKD